jgi:hypothetical protein
MEFGAAVAADGIAGQSDRIDQDAWTAMSRAKSRDFTFDSPIQVCRQGV